MAILAPRVVVEAIEAIRQSGRCNMLDRRCVQHAANEDEAYETVLWLEDNQRDYGRAVFGGFEIEEGD